MIGWLLDRLVDLFVLNSPRKGSLIPRDDEPTADHHGLGSVVGDARKRANDLLNASGPCQCMDCICGFNKPDPNRRPGQ